MKKFLIILFLSVVGEGLTAQTSILQQNAFLDSLIANADKANYDIVSRISILDTQLETKEYVVKKLKSDIVQLDKEIYNYQIYHERLNTQLEYEKKKYSELIVQADKIKNSMYQNFDLFSFDNLYKSFRQFLFIKNLSDYRAKKIKRIKDIKNEIANVTVSLDESKNKRSILAERLGVEQSFITKYKNNRRDIIAQFKAELSNKAQENAQPKVVQGDIYRPDSVSLAKASRPADTHNNVSEQDAFLFEVQKGYLEWPVKNSVIISSFGEKKHPVYDKITIRNDGINFLVPAYSEVKVVYDGEVSKIVSLPTNQFAIIVKHGTYFTVYSGLDHIKVESGDAVQKGDVIGNFENFENKLILNFQIWNGTQKINPYHWLKQNKKI